ncbi:MAG: ATP-binding protein [Fibrobacterota bacterium]
MEILVAEDDVISRRIIESCLKKRGHHSVVAVNGLEAWDIINNTKIDIALIDWVMPEMDGIDLIKRIKGGKHSRYIYTILVTGKDSEGDLVKGIEAGADDYIVKPIHFSILNSRIKAGSRIVEYSNLILRQRAALAEKNTSMEAMIERKTRQLIQAEKMATLGVLTAGVAHEINNPMTFISGNIQTLEMFWNEIGPKVGEGLLSDADNANRMKYIHEKMPRVIGGMQNGVRRIAKIIEGLHDFSRQDKEAMALFDVQETIESALEYCRNRLNGNMKVEKEFCPGPVSFYGNALRIEQVLINLIVNALDAIEEIGKGTLGIKVSKNEQVSVIIEDTGRGIPPHCLESIWEPFFTTKPTGKGTGLGLSISYNIIKTHGGSIKAENRDAGGARFTLLLPTDSIKKEMA